MAKTETVEATWVAPFEASLPDGTVLVPGETKAEIPAGEAEASDNWSVGKAQSTPKPDFLKDGDL